jgi:hypothetical protein
MTQHDTGGSVLGPNSDNFLLASGTTFNEIEVDIVLLEKTITIFVVKNYKHCSLILPFMLLQDKCHLLSDLKLFCIILCQIVGSEEDNVILFHKKKSQLIDLSD